MMYIVFQFWIKCPSSYCTFLPAPFFWCYLIPMEVWLFYCLLLRQINPKQSQYLKLFYHGIYEEVKKRHEIIVYMGSALVHMAVKINGLSYHQRLSSRLPEVHLQMFCS